MYVKTLGICMIWVCRSRDDELKSEEKNDCVLLKSSLRNRRSVNAMRSTSQHKLGVGVLCLVYLCSLYISVYWDEDQTKLMVLSLVHTLI